MQTLPGVSYACRFSRRAKTLLASYDLSPPPTIIEVDQRGTFKLLSVPRNPRTSRFDPTPPTLSPRFPTKLYFVWFACIPALTSGVLAGDGDLIKSILTRLTGRATFPNVILKGNSIGGSDDIFALHQRGKLAPMLRKAGLQIRADTNNLVPPR